MVFELVGSNQIIASQVAVKGWPSKAQKYFWQLYTERISILSLVGFPALAITLR